MKSIDVCPLKLFTFQCEESLTESVYNEVKKLKYRKNTNNFTSFDHYKNHELLNWFDECIEEVRKVKFQNLIEKFVITNCWANKTSPLQFHHEHNHPNSIISGVFHLTSHDSAEIEFLELDKWISAGQEQIFKITENRSFVSSKIKPLRGNLILFPSTLIHKTTALKKNEEDRYSISFNSFPYGFISEKNISSGINLNPISVREL